MPITNPKLQEHAFLEEMYEDSYFPVHAVDLGKAILVRLCEKIEVEKPSGLDALYELTHAATEEFNALQDVFDENESEIETAARECIAGDFRLIAEAYGFDDADPEDLIAPREW